MPNISEITAYTAYDQFIDKGKVETYLKPISTDKLTTFLEKIETVLIEESTNGGLDEYSLNLGGDAPLLTQTKKILTDIDTFKSNIADIIESMNKAAADHEIKEHERYQILVNKKITEYQTEINNLTTKINDTNPVNALFASYYQERRNKKRDLEEMEEKRDWSVGKVGSLI